MQGAVEKTIPVWVVSPESGSVSKELATLSPRLDREELQLEVQAVTGMNYTVLNQDAVIAAMYSPKHRAQFEAIVLQTPVSPPDFNSGPSGSFSLAGICIEPFQALFLVQGDEGWFSWKSSDAHKFFAIWQGKGYLLSCDAPLTINYHSSLEGQSVSTAKSTLLFIDFQQNLAVTPGPPMRVCSTVSWSQKFLRARNPAVGVYGSPTFNIDRLVVPQTTGIGAIQRARGSMIACAILVSESDHIDPLFSLRPETPKVA